MSDLEGERGDQLGGSGDRAPTEGEPRDLRVLVCQGEFSLRMRWSPPH